MKRIFFALLPLLLLVDNTNAQIEHIDVFPTYGYHFGGRVRYYQGDLKIKDAQTYGLTLSAPVDWNVNAELSWSRSDSRANFYSYHPDYEDDEFEMATNYFFLSAMKEAGQDNAKIFGGIQLGMAWFDSKDRRVDDVFRFCVGLGAGTKFMLTDKIGLRFQGRFLMPVYFQGFGFWFGGGSGGSGGGLTLNAGSTMLQGDLTGGIFFRLGQ